MASASPGESEARGWRRRIVVPVGAVLAAVLMLTALQRQLIYYPARTSQENLLGEAAAAGLASWRDGSGQVIGWRNPEGDARRRVMVLHGNAGYALHRVYYARGFAALDEGWQVFLFEYPGYGARDGSPSEEAIKRAALAALQRLLDEDDARPVYLVGESLGSGVAAYLAAEYSAQVAGLLLVTPFTSLVDVAAHHYPVLPVRLFLRERYDNREALARYGGPVAFLLAGRDEIVPTRLGRELYDRYRGPKWLRVDENAGHNSLDFRPGASWWRELSSFLLSTPAKALSPPD